MNDKDIFRDDLEVFMSNYSRGFEVQYFFSSRRRDLIIFQYFLFIIWSNGENYLDFSCRYIDNSFVLGMFWDMMEKISVLLVEFFRRLFYSFLFFVFFILFMILGFQNLFLVLNLYII